MLPPSTRKVTKVSKVKIAEKTNYLSYLLISEQLIHFYYAAFIL